MRYYLDTEFIERGPKYPIELISIGVVVEDGREYYAVSSECDWNNAGNWVKAHVLPHIKNEPKIPLGQIARDLVALTATDKPEFWAYVASYDWVVTCQAFGTMMDLPESWPHICNDLKVELGRHGNPRLPQQIESTLHHPLDDARWVKSSHEWLLSRRARRIARRPKIVSRVAHAAEALVAAAGPEAMCDIFNGDTPFWDHERDGDLDMALAREVVRLCAHYPSGREEWRMSGDAARRVRDEAARDGMFDTVDTALAAHIVETAVHIGEASPVPALAAAAAKVA